MESVGAKMSDVRPAADHIDNFDDRSTSPSDNWGTPRKHLSKGLEDRNDAALIWEPDEQTARHQIQEGGGEAESRNNVTKRVVHFSHPSPNSAHSTYSDSPLSVFKSNSPRIRDESPGLFVAEDEDEDEDEDDAEIVVRGQTEFSYTNNILHKLPDMDGLKRARAIKADIKDNIAVLEPLSKTASSRHKVEEDGENQLIKILRQDQNMKWKDIANFLNQERRQRGEAANLSEAAIYSRFVRNATDIVNAVGEVGFDPKDYMHLRHPNQNSTAPGTDASSKVGKKRIKDYDNAKELEANMRKQIKEDEHADLETTEKTEQLLDAVAKVERNFWILVADEMERATTRLYPPDVLASRYHAL